MAGYVVAERDVEERRSDGDTAATRVTIDRSVGCEHLEQRVIRFGVGCSRLRSADGRQEVLYVASGSGTLRLESGSAYAVEPNMGFYVAPGDRYEIENAGPDELVVVSVSAPRAGDARPHASRRAVRWADQPTLPAGKDREFRYLVDREAGCPDITQFVGVIPPGRAPMHSHTYDEVVYVVEGEGLLHLNGGETRIAEGSCIHLPPLVEHCLENTGATPMRVLGVFHPSGDPASRAYEANQ